MQRRSFLTRTALGGLALSLPLPAWASQDLKYTIEELMGKANLELYGEGYQLQEEAHLAFQEMKRDAYQDGITIQAVSSYRSYDRQRAIFERKYLQFTDDEGLTPLEAIDKIIEYSTIPGTSRHHWGTDVDLIDASKPTEGDVLVADKFAEGAPFADFKAWMDEHSEDYGFYLVYTDHPRRRGFKYEPWHYSYAPISIPMLKAYRSLNLVRLMDSEDFLGAEHFTTGFLRTYFTDNILDINPDLL
ncbi:M15 family metallopeptidase [Robiginitalea sp. M366]|uniref:M15 family metallopeptidase n=1 Tax=Robiginitalea aestuariiviva TaxID=3036903 RepID=UPI00240E6C04|nr:M15 family metallopeptidase [Robiginitalea aestuariiviva]MDG1570798.1 M15 family metallopeptidase [Robiginitalea aestuariiviva]